MSEVRRPAVAEAMAPQAEVFEFGIGNAEVGILDHCAERIAQRIGGARTKYGTHLLRLARAIPLAAR